MAKIKAVNQNPLTSGTNAQMRRVGPLITVQQLKDSYLYGFSLVGPDGREFPDSTLQFYIDNAISMLETALDISIVPTRDFEEYKDYRGIDYLDWGFLQLDNIPVISVKSLDMVYFRDEDGQPVTMQSIPLNWIRIQNHDGLLRLVPNSRFPGNLQVGNNGYFPQLMRSSMIPQAWRITYTFGFEDGKIPMLINQAVGMIASVYALSVLGNLVLGAGIASSSISLDGLSQSISTTQSAENSAYSATVKEYADALFGRNKEDPFAIIKILKAYYKGQDWYVL